MSGPYALLAATPAPTEIQDSGPGLIAFLIVAALVVACVLLYLSMRRHLRRINLPDDESGDAPPASRATSGG
jgi:hypothetical protein